MFFASLTVAFIPAATCFLFGLMFLFLVPYRSTMAAVPSSLEATLLQGVILIGVPIIPQEDYKWVTLKAYDITLMW